MAIGTIEPPGKQNERPSHLQHHFDSPVQQFESGKMGMWIFLATEILFFGGLFVAYAVYRANHPEIFFYAHQYLDKTLGGINTVVLICSSLTMAWAVRAAQLNQRTLLIACLALTVLCALGFMGNKFVEYEHKWKHGLLWGKHYTPQVHSTQKNEEKQLGESATSLNESVPINTEFQSSIAPAASGPSGLAIETVESHPQHEPKNVQIFFGIYFAMTGLHGLHVLIGIGVIGWLMMGAFQNRYTAEYFTPVDLVGLYWHLVDLIWIFLFPLLYLIH